MDNQPSAQVIALPGAASSNTRQNGISNTRKVGDFARVTPKISGAKDQETIDVLSSLLSEAVAGQLIGVAVVCRYRGTEYGTVTSGEAWRTPTFTRGALAFLDDRLAKFVGGDQ